MNFLGPVYKRQQGHVQPYIPLGPFQLRFPFVHYRFEIADFIQGLIMFAACLGIIPILMEYLGMPFDIAITIVILNGFLLLACSFGRPGRTWLDHTGNTSSSVAEDIS